MHIHQKVSGIRIVNVNNRLTFLDVSINVLSLLHSFFLCKP